MLKCTNCGKALSGESNHLATTYLCDTPRDLSAALDALTARVTSIDGQVMRESASLAVLVERVAQIAKALEAVEANVYATADDVPVGPRLCPDCFVAVGPGHVCPPRETDRLRALAEAVCEKLDTAESMETANPAAYRVTMDLFSTSVADAVRALRAYLRETAR